MISALAIGVLVTLGVFVVLGVLVMLGVLTAIGVFIEQPERDQTPWTVVSVPIFQIWTFRFV